MAGFKERLRMATVMRVDHYHIAATRILRLLAKAEPIISGTIPLRSLDAAILRRSGLT
jgi:hypothetical protein